MPSSSCYSQYKFSLLSSRRALLSAAALGLVLLPPCAYAFRPSRQLFARLMSSISGGFASRKGSRGPQLRKEPHKILFGNVDGPIRGSEEEVLMEPPVEREDPYFWVRDDSRKNPEVLEHLRAENENTKRALEHLQPLKDNLYKEFIAHMKETDEKVPYAHGPYFYFTRTEEGKAYRMHCRKRALEEDSVKAEIILDENEIAKAHSFCDVADVEPSREHTLLAYSVDFSGFETYDLHFKALTQAADCAVPDVIKDIADFTWGSDNSTIYYWTHDEEHRPHKLWIHEMGTLQEADRCIYTEKDKKFSCGSGVTANERFLLIESSSSLTTEVSYIDFRGVKGAKQHTGAAVKLFQKRKHGLRYDVEQWGDQWIILTNKDDAKNQKLMMCPVERNKTNLEEWVDYIPYNPDIYLQAITPFQKHIVLWGRENGFSQVWIMNPLTKVVKRLEWPEEIHSAQLGPNCNFDTDSLRLSYSSYTAPRQTLNCDMNTLCTTVLKEDPAPHYDRRMYSSALLTAKSLDGATSVPISVVYNNKIYPNGLNNSGDGNIPIYLYGYGSYGISGQPSFDFRRLSMLDRGVVYAHAHIRGGAEMGRYWYEDEGKFLTKKNTFNDFVAAAEHFVQTKISSPEKICICGRSAGGLLVGAAVNLRPDLFKAVIADVPFVDLLGTMCDSTIPLTTGEWEEWGNPNNKEFYYYMLEYSPYDNVRSTRYPAMFVSAGLYDSRVAYWEPTKWVAKLRETKTDDNPILLKMEMDCGHFSASDRYKHLREMAEETAFALGQLKATQLQVAGPPLK